MKSRQDQILDYLTSEGGIFVHDIAERFGVSVMTIRRDLVLLEKEGKLTRTHGGAVISNAGIIEFSFKEKEKECAIEKRAIAQKAAELIEPGMRITLDTGTTTLEVARAISGIKNLTVLTSSLVIASTLYPFDNIELVLLGGTVRRGNPDLSGWLTEENLKRFRVDLAILGADGADRNGVYTSDVNVARISQSMILSAKHVVTVMDHRKFDQPSFVQFSGWDEIHHVITDSATSSTVKKWLQNKTAKVTYAKL